MATGLKLYPVLVRALGPMPYAAKFLGVAFLGTHLPLLALVAYALARHGVDLRDQLDVLAVALAGTLAATALTLRAIHGLLEPVHATRDALRDYLARGVLVPLPERFRDAGGTLMRDVGFALRQLDARLRELEGVAATDHLTGLMNRRAGEEALRVVLAPAAEGGGAAGGVFHLLKIDVDDFKAVNDRFGHTVGDACLHRLAEVARSVLREGDWIARWGGDEFVAGIAAERDEHAAVAAGRVARALHAVAVPIAGGGALTLSASVGSAAAVPGDTMRSLYERADEALYRAKDARPARHQRRLERRAAPPQVA